ncbi:UNVERIFIED_CONTAM: hypothetical protein GTU68_000408 [Idotea baltica]|nr:hypothetical protein [Idotea baltica]MCL4121885.1 hypothetical protein [Idotea baltica]
MATLFRYNGKERELERKCGTKPYMAPEVLLRPYNAEPADIWSCGVVLIALLAGELPWDEPTFSCNEFLIWKDKDSNFISQSPWKKIDNLALSLLRKVLNTVPRYRATISSIKSHSWLVKDFHKAGASQNGACDRPSATSRNKRICSVLDNSSQDISIPDAASRLACSQPNPQTVFVKQSEEPLVPKVVPPNMSFSQPANPDHLLLSTQLSLETQSCHGTQTPLQKLVRRMTRILVRTSLPDTILHLESLFSKMNYSFKSHATNILTVTTVDRRGAQLVFKGNVLDMGPHILVDFRLSKGCGLDFKRHFLKIKNGLSHILVKGPVTWSMALATNMLPA